MKTIIKLFLFFLMPAFSHAQVSSIDSLKQLLHAEQKDTSRVFLLTQLSRIYLNFRPDTAMLFARQALSLAKQTDFTQGEAGSLNRMANVFSITGNYSKALELHLEGEKKSGNSRR